MMIFHRKGLPSLPNSMINPSATIHIKPILIDADNFREQAPPQPTPITGMELVS
jgi:hypothetical protein